MCKNLWRLDDFSCVIAKQTWRVARLGLDLPGRGQHKEHQNEIE